VLAMAKHLAVHFSGVTKVKEGQYQIRFHHFFCYFNMYRYFRRFAPIKHDSVHELFRSSKSKGAWKKEPSVEGQFMVTWREPVPPKELTGSVPFSLEDEKILSLLKQLQHDEHNKQHLFSRIFQFLDDEPKNKKRVQPKRNPKPKHQKKVIKGTSDSPHEITDMVAIQDSNMYIDCLAAPTPVLVPHNTRKRKREERELPPAKRYSPEIVNYQSTEQFVFPNFV